MQKFRLWVPTAVAGLAVVAALGLGVWNSRLNTANQGLSIELERERQRNFSEMIYHVEQIQGMLGKGLVASSTRQNMRYLSDVHYHAQAATSNFKSLPMPQQAGESTGKFLQQSGDFAASLLRNESAGRDMDARTQSQMMQLRNYSRDLAAQLNTIALNYQGGRFRWAPPIRFSWSGLIRGVGVGRPGKPNTGEQSPSSMVEGGWKAVGSSMGRLPVMLYDGPFSDHVGKRAPATSGAPITQSDAQRRLATYVPNFGGYTVAGVADVANDIPSWSFRLAPAAAGAAATGGGPQPGYTATAMISRNGGHLVQLLNARAVGPATIDLNRGRALGEQYLNSLGYTGMSPTYGQVNDGTATIAYAYKEQGVVAYPDQVKLRVALDTGEITGLDARPYLMSHHPRSRLSPTLSPAQAQTAVNPNLTVQRVQPALIPDQAGTGEILTYEVLATWGRDTYLVYVNAETGNEEQILQQVTTDGGTFVL